MKNFRIVLVWLIFILVMPCNLQGQELKKVEKFFKTKYYKGDTLIKRKAFKNELTKFDDSNKYLELSKTYNTLTWMFIAAEYGFLTWALTDGKRKNSIASTGVYSSVLISLIFNHLKNVKIEKAINVYNNNQNKKITLQPSKKGLGIVVTF